MIGTDEAFDRIFVMTGGEAYECKMLFTEGETEVTIQPFD